MSARPSQDLQRDASRESGAAEKAVLSASVFAAAQAEKLTLAKPFDKPKTLWQRLKVPKRDLDSIATQPSVFDDPTKLDAYRPPPQYENSHRFDPSARWTWREELLIIRKIDFRIMAWTVMMFVALDLDRSNISQANTDSFLQDLNMTTDDFNTGSTLFKLSFLLAELPSQLVSKRVGPDIWIPTQMVVWSVVAISQFWLSGRTSFFVTRSLLGLLQGGFIPEAILYLSYFYTASELPMRLAFFWASNCFTEIIGAFLATGILRLRGFHGRSGWRYLFLIEGCLTLAVGLMSYFLMPASPTQTKAWHRPQGWFSEREEVVMVNRVLRDDPSKSDMHNREGLSLRMIYDALRDWQMWPIYLLGTVHLLPTGPPHLYLTLILRGLGFSTTQANLLTIPGKVITALGLFLCAYLSELIDSRAITAVIVQIPVLPLLAVLYTSDQMTSKWVYFTAIMLATSFPYVHPMQVAWASRNSYSVRTRTVSAAAYNMFVQAGGIISSNIYRDDDKPFYKKGNLALIIVCVVNLCMYMLTFVYYRAINARREKIWSGWSKREQEEYLETTKDSGNQRLDFRFAY